MLRGGSGLNGMVFVFLRRKVIWVLDPYMMLTRLYLPNIGKSLGPLLLHCGAGLWESNTIRNFIQLLFRILGL